MKLIISISAILAFLVEVNAVPTKDHLVGDQDRYLKFNRNGKEICLNEKYFPSSTNSQTGHVTSKIPMFKPPTSSFVSGNEVVRAYSGDGCTGKSLSFSIDYEEGRCKYCWDSCGKKFNDGSEAHTFVRSVNIPEGVLALTFKTCSGSYGYDDPGFKGVLEPGCHNVGDDFIVHFKFAEEKSPGNYVILGQSFENYNNGHFDGELGVTHWSYGPDGIENAQGGSWYQYIFELLDPTEPRIRFQVGNGGTWLVPTQSEWQPGDPCRCDPRAWPATGGEEYCEEQDLTQCSNGCCGTDGCWWLMQTMEGGSGYWLGKLPTPKVKWTIGSVSKCYRYWSNSPLEVANSDDLECDSMGVIAVSNRLLYPPDGIGFVNDGMFGHAWINTPMGKVSRNDQRRALTLIVDTENFKGPVAYMLPEYYHVQSQWQDQNGNYHPAETFANSGMNTGGGAFEWSTVPIYGHQSDNSRDIRIPKMQFSFNEGKKTVMMSAGKSWTAKMDLYTPLNRAMDGKTNLNESKLLREGRGHVHPCEEGFENDLKLSFEGTPLNVARVRHREESDGMCSAVIDWDENNSSLNCNSTHCKLQDSYTVKSDTLTNVNGEWSYNEGGKLEAYNSIPTNLQGNNVFPEHNFWLNYDRRTPRKLCGSKPAKWTLYCRQTSTEDWIAWKWYAFKNQPGFQRLNLSNKQKKFLQRRMVRLHQAMEANAPLNQWLKTPQSMADLVTVDPKLLITPPEDRLKYGFVPIVIYQGMEKPNKCTIV